MRRDWIAGLVLLAVAAGYYRLAMDIPRSQLSDVVGAATFPRLLAIALAILSAILVLTGVLKRAPVAPAKAAEQAAEDRRAFLRAGGTVLIGVGYLVVIRWLGYPLAVALLVAAMLRYNRESFSWKMAAVSVGAGLFFWFLFGYLFAIPVPMGLWRLLLNS